MNRFALVLILTLLPISAAAQTPPTTWSAREGWFLQAGLDMTLQHPYGTNTGSAFREGRTGGLVVAAGRWFTPAIGLRARANWENGFAPLSNRGAAWLDFLHSDRPNAEHGGYLSVVGDVEMDIVGIVRDEQCRQGLWHLQVFPRAGLVYNFGLQKGSPLIGIGIGNTFRLAPRWSLVFDVAYQMVSSGFNGRWTDIGTGANGYLDATLSVQFDL